MAVVEVGRTERPVRVDPGDVVVVRLPENPTTGFVWSVSVSDPEVLTVEAEQLTGRDRSTAGGGGEREFRLRSRAGSPGTARVTLALSRPWESTPLEERTLLVQVGTG
ncbi:protease inhibitor I42 family protein [Micromonospora echinofusca]|uniref:Proteinase inhibitor I42 chagasin domain-containing protein n=1 Tax=Micromonospora echinofusca TaxID=47858 RepID=A0ABS3VSL3_MICEH|nr:protease inhibitor I42 family protein [Micromonospora echinofusca]MBO4207503.1 hypothetical protein [Micromonospora echinofusca]